MMAVVDIHHDVVLREIIKFIVHLSRFRGLAQRAVKSMHNRPVMFPALICNQSKNYAVWRLLLDLDIPPSGIFRVHKLSDLFSGQHLINWIMGHPLFRSIRPFSVIRLETGPAGHILRLRVPTIRKPFITSVPAWIKSVVSISIFSNKKNYTWSWRDR